VFMLHLIFHVTCFVFLCHPVFQVMLFPVYEHFVISTFTCLRRWMTAYEANPDDTSYWDQPPPAPEFMHVESKKKKKGEKKPRFRTTTVPPNADFTVCGVNCIIRATISLRQILRNSMAQFVKFFQIP